MKILIVGAGMYVTGRNNSGTGTILSSIAQYSKSSIVDEVVIVARNHENASVIQTETDRINNTIDSNLKTRFEPISVANDLRSDKMDVTNRFDAAIISVPDHLHFEYAKVLLDLGIKTLIVKPLTPTLGEALELREIQKGNNTYSAVEFHKRWDGTNLITKQFINSGKLGQVLYYEVGYSQRISIPLETFKGWSDKTNIFQYLGVHYVDLFYFLTGYKPIRCMALGTDGILKQKGVNTWDSIHVMLEWENPKTGSIVVSNLNTNWIDPNISSAMSDQRYKVIGTKGRLEIDQKNRGVEYVSEMDGIQQLNPYFSEYMEDANGDLQFQGYGQKSINQFLLDVADLNSGNISMKSLENKRPDILSSLVSTAVVDAVNESLEQNGAWIQVQDIEEIEWN
jgi:predicted dehydrogenase|tara:strand:+ start:1115 stop:2302 length:1188 start_codon:yes stop_codon:yes gene_type:complete